MTESQPTSAPKRAYTRLSPAAWAEIEALWISGDVTLAELSHRFGVTTRAIQSHVSKRGLVKGEAAKVVAAAVQAKVLSETLLDLDATARRALDVRERAYANACLIESMIVTQISAAQQDPTTIFAAASAVKMLGVAAQALERIHGLKRAALGLGDDDHLNAELPVLVLHDLTEEEIAEMRQGQEADDPDPEDLASDNDVVVIA